MKKYILASSLLLLVLSAFNVFSRPSGARVFQIRNETSTTVIVTAKMAPSEYKGPSYYWWGRQLIDEDGEEMWLYVEFFNLEREPFQQFPITQGGMRELFREHRDSSLSMPNLDKLRLLFASLIVTDDNGNVLKTLDSFTEDDFILSSVAMSTMRLRIR